MSLFDKIKDLFTDEEEVYETKEVVAFEKEEKEDKLPTFMRNKIEKEEQEEKKRELEREKEAKEIAVQIENKPIQANLKEKKSLSFDFKDEDFIENSRVTRNGIQRIKQEEKEERIVQENIKEPVIKPYSNKKEIDKPKKFKPTPVISPVYGVLDKNYNANEVVSKEEDSMTIQRASKKVDFESVRKKAYGSVKDEFRDPICENCEYLKEIRVSKKIERLSEEDLLYNMTVDDDYEDDVKIIDKSDSKDDVIDTEVIKKDEDIIDNDNSVNDNIDVTISEAEENYDDYGVNYEVPSRIKEKNDVKIVNHALNEVEASEVEFKENDKNKKDLELTDDLFNLIDSMYKERDD